MSPSGLIETVPAVLLFKPALPPKATAYSIRHSTITDLIHAGVDSMTVAQLAGTSVAMIEKHYGHLTRDHARAALAALAL